MDDLNQQPVPMVENDVEMLRKILDGTKPAAALERIVSYNAALRKILHDSVGVALTEFKSEMHRQFHSCEYQLKEINDRLDLLHNRISLRIPLPSIKKRAVKKRKITRKVTRKKK